MYTDRVEPRAIPGVVPLTEHGAKAQRIAVLILTIVPLLGLATAIVTLWGRGFGGVDATLFVIFYLLSALGVTAGYHRLFTHQSFTAGSVVRGAFAACGSLAMQGSVIPWVATHRRHHAFSDQEGDPHSPHMGDGEGIGAVFKGLWHAHLGWLFDPEETSCERWAPDLLKDPVVSKVNRMFPFIAVLSFTLPGLISLAITQSFYSAMTTFLWASLVRILLFHHISWSINSICHYYGKTPFESRDHSTNNWALSLLSMGESWHNNHHAFPTSARHGILAGQIDPSAWLIKGLERLGLVHDVKTVTEEQLESRRVA